LGTGGREQGAGGSEQGQGAGSREQGAGEKYLLLTPNSCTDAINRVSPNS